MISVKKSIKNLHFSICADLVHHGFIKDWRVNLHLFISNSLKSICGDSGAIAYRFDNFHKILTWQSIGHTQSFRTFAIRYKKSQKLQDTHLVSILKVIRKKWQWMVNYWIGVKRVTMMDQATRQQKTIYASLLSQNDWTKRILVQKSHEKNWINFQNWIWRRNGSASFNLVFWILVVEILILRW